MGEVAHSSANGGQTPPFSGPRPFTLQKGVFVRRTSIPNMRIPLPIHSFLTK